MSDDFYYNQSGYPPATPQPDAPPSYHDTQSGYGGHHQQSSYNSEGQRPFGYHRGYGEPLMEQEDNDQFFLSVAPSAQKQKVDYKLSDCRGRKRALLIGINYFNTPNELNGCINDVHNIKSFIMELYGFKEEDMVILTDDQSEPQFIPTRANIISAMQWLVNDAQENDSFFFHYSGHGGFVEDTSGDEADGVDETIYPVDHDQYEGTSGQIIDDELHEILVKPLPAGCRLTALFDSCHSATVLDLPYTYSTKGTVKDQNLFKDAGKGLLEAGLAYATSGNREAALSSIMELGQQLFKTRKVEDTNREELSSPADVIMFSGCKDDQTSADAQEAGKATGAMSYALTSTLRENPRQSYKELLNSVRDILREKYAQRPQLSSSHPLDVDLEFVC